MRTRNPNSVNQAFMAAFFGKDASKIPADHSQWPEPQRTIYNRMLAKHLTIVSWDFVKLMKNVAADVNTLNDSLSSQPIV